MITKLIKLLLLLSISFTFSYCSSDSSNNNLLTPLTTNSPFIFGLEPNRIHPSINYLNVNYSSSEVKIIGRNFSLNPLELKVSFGNIQGTIISSTESEIVVKSPEGISSGILSVSKSGGVCNSPDGKSGVNCYGRQYYVDCYEGIDKPFGEEIVLSETKVNNEVTYDKSINKAFKVDATLPNKIIQIRCPSQVTVTYFNNTCTPLTLTDVNNPQWTITEGNYTHQFIMFTTSGKCDIIVL